MDNGKAFVVLLTDLSKAFDCLSHELIIAKLNVYGLSLSALNLIQSYLSERKQKTKINQAFSSMQVIILIRSYFPWKNLLKNVLNGLLN